MVEVKRDNKGMAVGAGNAIGRRFQRGNQAGVQGNATYAANTWKRIHAIFDRELAIEVPYSGTTIAKEGLMVRAIIDGAIRLNPACLKLVAQVVFPKNTHITNIDARQVNVVGGLLDRLAKLESKQQSSASAQPEPINIKADVIDD